MQNQDCQDLVDSHSIFYACRTPLKKSDVPKLMAKALTILEAASADAHNVDILPESLRKQHNLMDWLQVRSQVYQHWIPAEPWFPLMIFMVSKSYFALRRQRLSE